MPGSNRVCLPDCVYSGYLGLSDRKGKEFGRSRASKFLGKICSAKRKVQYSSLGGGGDGRERETEKKERKPNVEVVIEGSCDVIGGDSCFD